jgi:cytochrome c biogenesis protein CcmG/thiol:disulfide interchange protein DsbE
LRRLPWTVVLVLPAIALFAVTLALRPEGSPGLPGRPGPRAADFEARAVPDDRPAPTFELAELGGNRAIDLKEFRGDVVVLNIWASWCPPCRTEAPALSATWARYRSRGVHFLGVNHLDTEPAALEFVREFRVSYPSVFDPKGEVAARYGALGIPSTFVITPEGRIAYRFLGRVTVRSLSRVLDDVLSGV